MSKEIRGLSKRQLKLIECSLYHTFHKLGVKHLHGEKYSEESAELMRKINLQLKKWNGKKNED